MRRRTEREKEVLRRKVLADRTLAAEQELASEDKPEPVKGRIDAAARALRRAGITIPPARKKSRGH